MYIYVCINFRCFFVWWLGLGLFFVLFMFLYINGFKFLVVLFDKINIIYDFVIGKVMLLLYWSLLYIW